MNQIMLEILRQKKFTIAMILALILLNLALFALINYYQTSALATAQERWSDLRRKAATVGRADSTSLYRQGLSDLEKLKTRIPAKREFARVLSDLMESAAGSGVQTGSISYKPQVIKEEGLLSYQLTFSVRGSYAAIKSYLADLQENPELIVVDDVAFSNNDPLVENVEMNLRITVYLQGGA
ncbi:MAG: type 4a pilus biogenesis protein PilO [Geobacteraceae bacterium]|nr:type 4a pilus biogenesis protein PilO [Geobacteraceae bacterium]